MSVIVNGVNIIWLGTAEEEILIFYVCGFNYELHHESVVRIDGKQKPMYKNVYETLYV